MASTLRSVDWSLIQTFVAVAQCGSLSGAARHLGHSQPTVGRHIKALEAILGVSLFVRSSRGLELSEVGHSLIDAARDMATAASRMQLAADAASHSLRGTVRVTASHLISHHLMPAIFAQIRQAEPEIQLELVPSDTSENLLFREADIAIRNYRPSQLELITKHVCDLPIALYGATSYLARAGTPTTTQALANHEFVGLDRLDDLIVGMKAMGHAVARDFFSVRTDSLPVYWEMVRAGCGLGPGLVAIAQSDESVQRILDVEGTPLAIWLSAPEVLRTSPRIRRVYDLLDSAFASLG